MKTQVLWAAAATLFLFTIIGCSKDDTEAPIITLTEPTVVTLNIGQSFVDPGYSATDNEDGDLTSQVVVDLSDLNIARTGTYTVYYSVSDEAGNLASAERTVIVQNSLAQYNIAGVWSISETCGSSPSTYSDTISNSETENGKIIFTRFANYLGANATANISVSGTGGTIIIPQQSIVCGLPPQATRQFTGTGNLSISGSSLTMVVSYTELTNGTSTSCTATYTK